MASTITIRPATPDDVAQIALHRRLMFNDMYDYDPETLDQLEHDFQVWVKERYQSGHYLGWFALNAAGEIVGGAGLWVQAWPPHPSDLSQRRGHVMDVYVVPEYRRRGIARQLLQAVIAACEAEGFCMVTLAASHLGRPLYEELGFEASNIMHRKLK